MILSGCGGSNDTGMNSDEYDNGKNKTDVAVTGGASGYGMAYARISGYVNLDKLPSSVKSKEIGIEYSSVSDMSDATHLQRKKTQQLLTGDVFVIGISGLTPGTSYYFRTYVLGDDDIYRYGETRSFTTKEITSNAVIDCEVYPSYTSTDITYIIDSSKPTADAADLNQCMYYIAVSASKSRLTKDSIWHTIYESCDPKGNKATFEALAPNTKYYCCGYTSINGKCVLGDIKSFTTKQVTPSGYIGLGLSSGTKWSVANYGAASPQDAGTMANWFDISDKKLSAPTYDQWAELWSECTWKHTYMYQGTEGYIVRGNNGNSIFLPLIPYRGSTYYWSSTTDVEKKEYATAMDINCVDATIQGRSSIKSSNLFVREVSK